MINKVIQGALGVGMMTSMLALSACGSNSSSATADARKKVPVTTTSGGSGSTTTTTTTTTTTAATITVASSSDNPLVGVSPGVGAAAIATTDHDVMDDLQPTWGNGAIPASNAPDVVGAFRFICRHTNLATDDPTVYPKQAGVSHLHDQTGVNGWNASSTYGNLRTGGGGSGCNDVAANDHDSSKSTHSANRTPYWQPALLDGKGNVILADYTSFYYKRRPLSDPIVSDPSNPQYQGKGVPLPNGIKFIFGAFPEEPSRAPTAVPQYGCTNGAAGASYPTDGTFAGAVACAKSHADGTLEVHFSAPNCWDGVNLDSADHRSHVAYSSFSGGYEKCDAAHPYVIPTFTYAAFYTILPTDTGDIHFSSDEMDNSKPRGWSFHVDYGPAAWDPKVLAMWENGCIDSFLNCSGGDLGNGLQLKGAAEPIYQINGVWTPSWRNPQRLVPVPAKSTS